MTQTNLHDSLFQLRKSTNVRIRKAELEALKLGFGALQRVSPTLASDLVFHLAFKARRHQRPEWERRHLENAELHRFPWRNGHLMAWSWGRGPVVLLVHGWEGRGTQLGWFIEPLVERGYRVVTFDGPGHGDTTVTRGSLPDQAAAIRFLEPRFGPFHAVVAHSMGAGSAALAASFGLDVRRMVLMAPPSGVQEYIDILTKMFGLDSETLTNMVNKLEQELRIPVENLHLPDRVRGFTLPVLVVHDRKDREIPLEKGLAIADAWPNAELLVTNGLGHRRILKERDVIDRIVDFVDESGELKAA